MLAQMRVRANRSEGLSRNDQWLPLLTVVLLRSGPRAECLQLWFDKVEKDAAPFEKESGEDRKQSARSSPHQDCVADLLTLSRDHPRGRRLVPRQPVVRLDIEAQLGHAGPVLLESVSGVSLAAVDGQEAVHQYAIGCVEEILIPNQEAPVVVIGAGLRFSG